MKNFLIKIWVFLVVIFLGLPFAAQGQGTATDSYTHHGRVMLEWGNVTEAVDDFSKAILRDPHNREAQGQLMALASQGSLTPQQRINLVLLKDLVKYNQSLEAKVDYYETKNRLLREILIQKGYPVPFSDEEIIQIKFNGTSAEPLEQVNAALRFEKQQLSDKIVFLKKEYDRLRNVRSENFSNVRRVVKTQPSERITHFYNPYSEDFHNRTKGSTESLNVPSEQIIRNQDMYAAQFKPVEVPTVISASREDALMLKNELALVLGKLNNLERNITQKDQRIEELNKQIVNYALELSEVKMMLTQKIEKISSFNTALIDIQSRFELGQRIIQEKDGTIQSVQAMLQEVRTQLFSRENEIKTILTSKDEKLVELNGILQVYKEKLGDVHQEVKEKGASVSTLEDQLTLVQVKMFEKNKMLRKTQEQFLKLEGQLKDIQNNVFELKGYSKGNSKILEFDEDVSGLQGELKNIHQFLLKQLSSFEDSNSNFAVEDLRDVREMLDK